MGMPKSCLVKRHTRIISLFQQVELLPIEWWVSGWDEINQNDKIVILPILRYIYIYIYIYIKIDDDINQNGKIIPSPTSPTTTSPPSHSTPPPPVTIFISVLAAATAITIQLSLLSSYPKLSQSKPPKLFKYKIIFL